MQASTGHRCAAVLVAASASGQGKTTVACALARLHALWAQCGGMAVVFDALIDAYGQSHAMSGLLPGSITHGRRLVALRPQQLQLGGHVLRGHSAQHCSCATPLPSWAHCQVVRGGTAGSAVAEAAYMRGPVRASYIRALFPSRVALVAALLSPQALPVHPVEPVT